MSDMKKFKAVFYDLLCPITITTSLDTTREEARKKVRELLDCDGHRECLARWQKDGEMIMTLEEYSQGFDLWLLLYELRRVARGD